MSWKWIWFDKQKYISITDHLYEVWYDLSLLCKEDSSTSTKSPPLLYSLRYAVSSPPISGSGPRDRIDSNRGIWKSKHTQIKINLHLLKWWNEIQYVHTFIGNCLPKHIYYLFRIYTHTYMHVSTVCMYTSHLPFPKEMLWWVNAHYPMLLTSPSAAHTLSLATHSFPPPVHDRGIHDEKWIAMRT